MHTTLTTCLRAKSSLTMTDSDVADFLPVCDAAKARGNLLNVMSRVYLHFPMPTSGQTVPSKLTELKVCN